MSISESEHYDLLDRQAEEFAERFRRGERPALKEYTDCYPELADEIRDLFPAMVRVEQVEEAHVDQECEAKTPGPASSLEQIGDYRIVGEIGRGGMGVVYEAEQVSLGRRVALKVLPRHVAADRMTLERFRREARAAARLHHTNIVPVHDVGEDREVRYYATQLIQGQGLDAVITYALALTLYELLTLRPGFDSPDRLKLIEQIKTEEPPKPRSTDARIPRDLETIVQKAIEKDPKARYQSAEAMGEDLRRFLAYEPIQARRVGAAERYWRWARRNPGIAVLGGVLTGVLVLATVSSLLAMERFRSQAETQRTLADAREIERRSADRARPVEASARGKADQANANLLATQEELRRTVYATRSNLAVAAWEANDLGRLRFLLDLMQPRQDEPDFRGWEWHYLKRLAKEEQLTFGDHDREVSQVAFSPDGRTVASVQWGGRVQLWDPATGHVRLTLQPPHPSTISPLQAGVSGLAFSPDGERLAGPGPDATLGIWNTHTPNTPPKEFRGPT